MVGWEKPSLFRISAIVVNVMNLNISEVFKHACIWIYTFQDNKLIKGTRGHILSLTLLRNIGRKGGFMKLDFKDVPVIAKRFVHVHASIYLPCMRPANSS